VAVDRRESWWIVGEIGKSGELVSSTAVDWWIEDDGWFDELKA
jgi:hypothetical protein